MKRKSDVSALSDSEDVSAPPSRSTTSSAQSLPVSRASSMYSIPASESGLRIRKGVVLSDDEDAPQPPPLRKSRSSKSSMMDSDVDSEAERDLKLMMDVDDGIYFTTRRSRCTD
jgi:DNA polymerase delta subunit 3